MISAEDALRLANLRERIFRCIEDELRRDGHHKSYEGAIEITMNFPNFFERAQPIGWILSFHAYVLPFEGRHKHFEGKTFAEALSKAEHVIGKICEEYEFARFTREMDKLDDESGEADGSSTIYGDPRSPSDR